MTALITIRDKGGRKVRFGCTLQKIDGVYYWVIGYPNKVKYDCIFYTKGDSYYSVYAQCFIETSRNQYELATNFTNRIPFEEWHLSKWATKYNECNNL